MRVKYTFLICFMLFISVIHVSGQNQTAGKDSIKIYKQILIFSERSRFAKFFYDLIFKPLAQTKTNKLVSPDLLQRSYAPYEGKIVRNIFIDTYDPFGYNISGAHLVPQHKISEFLNQLHVKSRISTIRNLLIFKKNQPFDSLRVKESERLIRSQDYVYDVSFFVNEVKKNSDSVDVYIHELDNWSIEPGISGSAEPLSISIGDKNFLGLGHQFQNDFNWYHSKGELAYNTKYYIPNIHNTYISTTLNYGTDQFGNFVKSIGVDRPFFSPLAKWAMGISLATQFRKDSVKDASGLYVPFHPKFTIQDEWVGKAFRIFKGNQEGERVTNLILTSRYLRIRYIEKPVDLYDPYNIYTNEDFYFGGVGISARKYIRDQYIFNFGVIEDIPVGRVYALTGGYQIKNGIGRYYLDARIAYGNYLSWGYWSADWEYATFFNNSRTEQGEISASANYFSPLFRIGNWKFRQFVKPQFTLGLNRLPYDSLTLNRGYGIEGFNSLALRGTKRMVLTLQTQSYAPWNLIGFNFGPYLIYSLGILGDEQTGFKHHKVYSQLGLGVLIKNERLVFNTFQLSVSFYPLIPGRGRNVFKFNSFRTTDFGLKDFSIDKPSTLTFR